MNVPNKWVILELDVDPTIYKVFAMWYGGYLDGDSWRLNSGITKVEKDGEYYLFHGHSGSVYKCHEKSYGTSSYGAGVIENLIEQAKDHDVTIKVLSDKADFLNLVKEQ